MDAIEQRQYTLEELATIAKALGYGEKNTPASTTLAAPTLHGPFAGTSSTQYGLFSQPGARPDMLSTLIRPDSLAATLRPIPSRYTDEDFEIMTGQTLGSGTNATSFAGNPPVVGQGKVARIRYNFGRYYIKTDLEAVPEVGQLRNRADVPRNILNAGPQANPFIPDVMYRMDDTQSHMRYELFRIGVDAERTHEHVLVQGDNTLTSANTQLGWIGEYHGLDNLIKTGYTDVVSTYAAPALDSAIITFGVDVDGTIGGGDGRNFVQALHDLMFGLKQRARKMGMANVQWAIVCRAELYRAAAEIYPCQYASYKCSTGSSDTINLDAVNQNNLRISLLNGQYFPIDGQNIPVIFSEGIAQQIVGNFHFQSDMYIVPLAWQGMPLTYLEYFPMNNQYAMEFGNAFGQNIVTPLNNGLWLAGHRSTGLAIEWHFGAKFRLVLETPHLAGRIDNLNYIQRANIRNADPNDTFFYADGGISYRS